MRVIKSTCNETGRVDDLQGKEYPPKCCECPALNAGVVPNRYNTVTGDISFIFPVEHYLTILEGKGEAYNFVNNWRYLSGCFLFFFYTCILKEMFVWNINGFLSYRLCWPLVWH